VRSRDLLPGERLVLTAHEHGIFLIRPAAAAILGGAVAMAAALLIPLPREATLFVMLGILVVLLAALNLIYWRWRSQEYVVTDQRVIVNEGMISTFSRSIAVDRIQDLTVYQGLFGRTWNFGDLEIESAGREGGEWLRRVPRPQRVRNAIFTQMEGRRRASGPAL
jgi:uncharacterized membrane protein YdbT with pleckstrin-like domain